VVLGADSAGCAASNGKGPRRWGSDPKKRASAMATSTTTSTPGRDHGRQRIGRQKQVVELLLQLLDDTCRSYSTNVLEKTEIVGVVLRRM
jgi:hypothetical protein